MAARIGQIEVLMNGKGTADKDVVVGQFPARAEFVAALRGLATAIGAAHDLTVDAIEDLQIAIAESCVLLLPLATRDPLEARFTLLPRHLAVTVSVPAEEAGDIDRDELAWTVLSAVAAELDARVADNCAVVSFTVTRER